MAQKAAALTPPDRLNDGQRHPVTVVQPVHRGVWATAMRYAGGKPELVTTITPTHVEVTVT